MCKIIEFRGDSEEVWRADSHSNPQWNFCGGFAVSDCYPSEIQTLSPVLDFQTRLRLCPSERESGHLGRPNTFSVILRSEKEPQL